VTTTERSDLIRAVLASRDELDPDLDTKLLEAIVDAEAGLPEDGQGAMRAIDAAVTAAIERGVGKLHEPDPATAEATEQEGEEGAV
jgi:hypothetical protein